MNRLELADMWSISSSAFYGWITGLAAGGLHQVHFALAQDIPDNGFLRVVNILMAAGCAGAILFAGVAALRNHRERHAAIARTVLGSNATTTTARATDERQRAASDLQPKEFTPPGMTDETA
jgi:hypothetical protein